MNAYAPKAWPYEKVPEVVIKNTLYLPIADAAVKKIPIQDSEEEFVDLLEVNNPRIRPMGIFDHRYANSYEGYSRVRRGVYEKFLVMLEFLPKNLGIAYFEGFRPFFRFKLRNIPSTCDCTLVRQLSRWSASESSSFTIKQSATFTFAP